MNDVQALDFFQSAYPDVWNKRSSDVVEKYYARDLKASTNDINLDLSDIRKQLAFMNKNYSSLTHNVHSAHAEDNKIIVRLSQIAKDFNQKVVLTLETFATYELKDDKISKLWFMWDKPSDDVMPHLKKNHSQRDSLENILTKRELQCLYYLLKGLTAKHSAFMLGLSARTVEYYLSNLKSKLQINSNSALFEYAYAQGLLQTSAKLDELLKTADLELIE